MFKRILVAVDGSPASDQGLKSATELAADQHATLYVVHVVDDLLRGPTGDGLFAADYLDQMIESLHVAGRELLARSEALARERGVEVRPRLVEVCGQTVARAIVAQVSEQNADLVVLGTHGRRGLRRLVLGSDAESVLRDSPVPVLLVRSPEHAKPHTHPVKQDSTTQTASRPAGDRPSAESIVLW